MNPIRKRLIGGCAAAVLSVAAFAQAGTGGGMPRLEAAKPAAAAAAIDCSKARNQQSCEARQKAIASCKDRTGQAHRQCVADSMPARDCSKAREPRRCEEQQKARDACKGKYGKERNACVRAQIQKGGGKPPAKS